MKYLILLVQSSHEIKMKLTPLSFLVSSLPVFFCDWVALSNVGGEGRGGRGGRGVGEVGTLGVGFEEPGP